jgi:hypothetical protein
MGMETASEILFTRQRHEAKRAGLHYDIRLVHGDVAYSWATKKDMPKPGEAIILHQQPIHDSGYALSEKVVIPEGQYGAGVTYLDFVRKAQLKKAEKGDHFTLHTKDGEVYLLKQIPAYGGKQWLFKNLTGIYGKNKAETVQEKVDEIIKSAKDNGDRPHTIRALKKLDKQDGLLIDHSMGSGKTRLYLRAIENHQKKNPDDNVLIMAPASLTTNVYKEIKKHGIKINTSKLETLSYEKATIDADKLKKKVYGMVVADEAHKLRNSDTKRHQELSEVIVKAKKRLLGTGTSAYNHPADVAPLVNLAAGERVLPEGKRHFEERYIEKTIEQPPLLKRILGHPPTEIQKLRNKKELGKILRKHIDHYDLKDDPSAADKFPKKNETVKEVEMSPEQHSLYRYMEGKLPFHLRMKVRLNMPLDKRDVSALQSFSTGVRQVSNSMRSFMPNYDDTTPKIKAAVDSLQEGMKKHKQFRGLVYSNYLGSGLEDYSQELTKRGIPHAAYHGGLSKTQKDELLEQYNSGKLPVLLISSSGAEGLNTRGTRKVQVLEPHYNKSKIDQVVARAVRYESHEHLPPADRNVDVEHYLSVLPQHRWHIGPRQHSIDQYLHHNSKSKHVITEEMKELVKEAEESSSMVKEALNALKARAMAKTVGVIADHTTQWKYGLRKLRDSRGNPLAHEALDRAKARMGAIHKDDFKAIAKHQAQHPGKEVGFAIGKNGRIQGHLEVGDSHAVSLDIGKGTRMGHTHPEVPENDTFFQGHRIAHASGLRETELPFKARSLKKADTHYQYAKHILNHSDIPEHFKVPIIRLHTKGLVGHVDWNSGHVHRGLTGDGRDVANAIVHGNINGISRSSTQNIVSAEHGVDAVHKSTGVTHSDGTVLLNKHRTVMFKQSAVMVKCEELLTDMVKSAFFDRPEHTYERAKYKESKDWDNIKDPVGSVKWDGAAFFMEIQPDGTPRFLSRRPSVKGGFPDRTPNLMHLKDMKMPQYAGDVYHVELVHTGHEFHDDILDSHPIVSGILNSKPARALETQAQIGPVRAVLLDVVKPVLPTYKDKLDYLKGVKEAFKDVPNLHMPNIKIGKDEISELVQRTKKQGQEGVIITSLSAPEEKNTRVKIKHVDTYNLRVVGVIQEIDKFGNPKESMGALEVADATGRIVAKVGTGFLRSLRKEIWENKDQWIGRLIQVKAMPTTSSRLRAPVYNGLADGDLDTVQEKFAAV